MRFSFEPFEDLGKKQEDSTGLFKLEYGKFSGGFSIKGMYYDWAEIVEMLKGKKMVEAFYNRAVFNYFGLGVNLVKKTGSEFTADWGKLSFKGFILGMNILSGHFEYDYKYVMSLGELLEQIPQKLFPDFLRAILVWAREENYV